MLQAFFIFDNAPSHRKMADDALNVDKMNVGPGGKQPKMRDTVWGGAVQRLVDDDGVPKGMRIVLQERGVDTTKMKAKDMRDLLKTFPDFNRQKTILEDYIERRGHICFYYLKFHCELSPIERVWCQPKKYTRAYIDGTITRLRKVVPEGLDSVTLELMKKFFRTCRDYERTYRGGGSGREVEERVKIYKSHRRIFSENVYACFLFCCNVKSDIYGYTPQPLPLSLIALYLPFTNLCIALYYVMLLLFLPYLCYFCLVLFPVFHGFYQSHHIYKRCTSCC